MWVMALSEAVLRVSVKSKHRKTMTQSHLMKSQQLTYDTFQITMQWFLNSCPERQYDSFSEIP